MIYVVLRMPDDPAVRIVPQVQRRKTEGNKRTWSIGIARETFGIHGNVSRSVSLSCRVSMEFRTFAILEKSSRSELRYFQLPFVFEASLFLSFSLSRRVNTKERNSE